MDVMFQADTEGGLTPASIYNAAIVKTLGNQGLKKLDYIHIVSLVANADVCKHSRWKLPRAFTVFALPIKRNFSHFCIALKTGLQLTQRYYNLP